MITVTLPWPPSVNAYWRQFRGRAIISKAGREYRQAVLAILLPMRLTPYDQPVRVDIAAQQPDKRRRDVDNLAKAILDGLKAGQAYTDDSLIHDLRIRWLHMGSPGTVRITITPMDTP
jgi:crossover junction endodeoxyribonuclease RusA